MLTINIAVFEPLMLSAIHESFIVNTWIASFKHILKTYYIYDDSTVQPYPAVHTGYHGATMSFEDESFMDRLIGSIKLGRSLSAIQSDLSKELLNRLRIETERGFLNESHHNCCQLFMKELERTMEAPALRGGGIQIGSIFGNNNTINYGNGQTSEARASAGATLNEEEKAYGDMQGEVR